MDPFDHNENSSPAKAGTGPSGANPTGIFSKTQDDLSQSGPQHSAPKFVERKTALRGQAIASRRRPAQVIRKNTESDLHDKDPEVPYVKTERAIRDLVCSLMERQDRMNEELLLRVVDLQYRIEDLEAGQPEERYGEAGDGWEVPG